MDLLPQGASLRHAQTKEADGIVVWDHNGVVVVWPDGHRSRFSWTGLRQVCRCAECQQQQEHNNGSRNHRHDNRETAVEG